MTTAKPNNSHYFKHIPAQAFALLISGLAVYFFTLKAPDLKYTISTSVKHEDIGLFRFKVINVGNDKAENVVCHISIPEGNVIKSKSATFDPPIIEVTPTEEFKPSLSGKIVYEISTMNTGESFQVSLLFDKYESHPEIYLRGDNVSGRLSSSEIDGRQIAFLIISSAIAICAAIVTIFAVSGYFNQYPQKYKKE